MRPWTTRRVVTSSTSHCLRPAQGGEYLAPCRCSWPPAERCSVIGRIQFDPFPDPNRPSSGARVGRGCDDRPTPRRSTSAGWSWSDRPPQTVSCRLFPGHRPAASIWRFFARSPGGGAVAWSTLVLLRVVRCHSSGVLLLSPPMVVRPMAQSRDVGEGAMLHEHRLEPWNVRWHACFGTAPCSRTLTRHCLLLLPGLPGSSASTRRHVRRGGESSCIEGSQLDGSRNAGRPGHFLTGRLLIDPAQRTVRVTAMLTGSWRLSPSAFRCQISTE